jgi:hypothetical protein
MKVINSRGRVLLEVRDARTLPDGRVFYSWRGDGCGGYGPREHLERTIATIKADAPSARVIGTLPAVQP